MRGELLKLPYAVEYVVTSGISSIVMRYECMLRLCLIIKLDNRYLDNIVPLQNKRMAFCNAYNQQEGLSTE
jgi:hypothetical protein